MTAATGCYILTNRRRAAAGRLEGGVEVLDPGTLSELDILPAPAGNRY